MARGITPACAGNSYFFSTPFKRRWDHPRLRGEQIHPTRTRARNGGSPPLARGTARFTSSTALLRGITPACAGNSPLPHKPVFQSWDHPRLRGEQWQQFQPPTEAQGSPPLARGTATVTSATSMVGRITPACAGNSSCI